MENKIFYLKDLKQGDRIKEPDGTMRLVIGRPSHIEERKMFVNVATGWTSFNDSPVNSVYGVLCDENWNPLPEPEKTYHIGQRFFHDGAIWMLSPTTNRNEVHMVIVEAREDHRVGLRNGKGIVVDDPHAVPAGVIDRFWGMGEWEAVVTP